MTTTHTQGRIAVEDGALYAENIGNQYGYQVAIVNHQGTDFPANVVEANARRLAACWNVCQGFDTEVLESILLMGETMLTRFQARTRVEETLIADRLKAIRERDAARAALELAECIAQRVIAATGFDESQVSDWRPVVRAAKTGSAPAPLQDITITTNSVCGKPGTTCNWVETKPYGSKCTTCGETIPF